MHSRLIEEANAIANLEIAMKAVPASAPAIIAALESLNGCLVTDNDSARCADVISAGEEKLMLIHNFDKRMHGLNNAITAKGMTMLDSAIEAANTLVRDDK